jgi:hypothetical protein
LFLPAQYVAPHSPSKRQLVFCTLVLRSSRDGRKVVFQKRVTSQESGGALRFSTDDLPERDRLPIWREAFGRTIVKMDMEPIGDGPFRSRADIQMLPNLSIAVVSSSPNRVTRTPALIADGSDDLVFGILLGGAVAYQGKKEVGFRAGEALLWSNDAPGGCR